MFKWLEDNKKWFLSGAGIFIIVSVVAVISGFFTVGSDGAVKATVTGAGNVLTQGDGNNVVITNQIDKTKIAVVEVLEGVDAHLGDNVYPRRYGTSHNPLNIDIYKQGVKGIVYYDKLEDVFLADIGRPTLVGQALVDHMARIVADIDFSSFSWVYAYDTDHPEYRSIEEKFSGSNAMIKLGSTLLVADPETEGNFYGRYAAVGIGRSVSLISECARSGIDTTDKENLTVQCIIHCYHGGIRSGQSENFKLQFNNYSVDIPSRTRSMRDIQEIVIDIPVDQVAFDRNNLLYIYVLPWIEELPQLATENGVVKPAHFRDVGITHLEIQVVEK